MMDSATTTVERPVDEPAPGTSRRIGEVMLTVENVVMRFGGVTAIKGVSFDIRRGEIRAIIGPNGAGKTSMLNVINGVYHPQEGKIVFRGEKRRRMRSGSGTPLNTVSHTEVVLAQPCKDDSAFYAARINHGCRGPNWCTEARPPVHSGRI